MKKFLRLALSPMFSADGGGGGGAGDGGQQPQTVTIGGKEYAHADLEKMLTEHGKLTTEIGPLREAAQNAQQWLEFDKYVGQFPPEVQKQFAENVNTFFANIAAGTATQKDITGINKVIKAAEQNGDNKAADALKDARDEALSELLVEKEFASISKQAKADGIEYDEDKFRDFLAKHLEEEGFGDEDEFDSKEIKRAYKLYRAEQKEKQVEDERKKRLPNVGNGGSGMGPGGNKDKSTAPKNLREAERMAKERLRS